MPLPKLTIPCRRDGRDTFWPGNRQLQVRRKKLAEHYLENAYQKLPMIAGYLLKSKVRQPEISPNGITHGGEDEACIDRNEMRDTWKSTQRSLKWLKDAIAKWGRP